MDFKKIFEEVMAEQQEIALATSVAEQPNVRIVNFLYSPERKVVYFSTFEGNDKVNEMSVNSKISFTTIVGEGDDAHVRVLEGRAKRSERSLKDIADPLIKKFPFYAEIIDNSAEHIVVFELSFNKAVVISGMEIREEIVI
ncbi:pyridoxamine 5'-phosphate oxidase family protein [Enterococcus sp. BWT-B8]|uniref:pyridoxamine 5'-phosphate oxidase family protein n=1 Tax=Enterococcus sp. BWT-B8 TaxID=2885157 RepID=UPI001E556C5D|nr:pyridoxamine 5'-phosphate oxidase family protein [Enterococcus sp. BWT-B8]MCB5951057.1 pyridoxamine 5'-phosphate oxidase family protein [Enterococcus sp. BWT-B8]